jgi:hypothetical protein
MMLDYYSACKSICQQEFSKKFKFLKIFISCSGGGGAIVFLGDEFCLKKIEKQTGSASFQPKTKK